MKTISKVFGRRNWVIRTYDNTATLYGFGQAKKFHLLCERIDNIAKHHITWLEYTYKADALKALTELAVKGYKTQIYSF